MASRLDQQNRAQQAQDQSFVHLRITSFKSLDAAFTGNHHHTVAGFDVVVAKGHDHLALPNNDRHQRAGADCRGFCSGMPI